MSREQPFRIEQDGYACRVTMDAHYVSDEDAQRIVNTLKQLRRENAELRELVKKMYDYYVSGTLTPCDFCKRYDCEGDAPTTCEVDEYDPNGDELVRTEIERMARELRVEVDE